MVDVGSKIDLARSQIGMVVRAGAATPNISTVDTFRQTLLGARSIAYSDSASGVYLSTVLFKKLGIADQIAGRTPLSSCTRASTIVSRRRRVGRLPAPRTSHSIVVCDLQPDGSEANCKKTRV